MAETIQLSEGFFQELAENPDFANLEPVLQILQSRVVENGNVCIRIKASDGTFSYSSCGILSTIAEKVKEDGLADPNRFPVIKVNKYTTNQANGKPILTIHNYDLLAIDIPKIGNPNSHTGDPETFRGIGAAKRKLQETIKDENIRHAAEPQRKAVKHDSGEPVLPIAGLTPFLSGKWRINGLVTARDQIKEIQSKKGPMKVFNFTLTDRDGSSVRIAAFGDTAEKVHGQIEENVSYYVTGTPQNIRPANKRFNNTGHDYELTLGYDSTVEKSDDQSIEAPKFVIKKTDLSALSGMVNQVVDILAVIDKVEDVSSFKSKDNRDMTRRHVHLIDESLTTINLTLWGDTALHFGNQDGQQMHMEGRVIGIKGAFVKEFQGSISLSINSGSRVEIDPESSDTDNLLRWYTTERDTADIKALSIQNTTPGGNFVDEIRTIALLNEQYVLANYERGMYFNTIGMITSIRQENAVYMACPVDGCGKKVSEIDGHFRCEKCYKTHPTFNHRYMVSMEISDAVSSLWVTLFDDKAVSLFGKSAKEMGELKTADANAYKAIFDAKLFLSYNFRMRARPETYQDNTRTRYTAFDMKAIDCEQYDTALSNAISRLETL